MPGENALAQTHWVFPVCSGKPEELIGKLVAAGFDATASQSMEVIEAPVGREDMATVGAAQVYGRMVYLPVYPEMGETEILRMARILSDHAAER
jgi:dTDP-4-amino-4,6-dideoxygalactose transaminase